MQSEGSVCSIKSNLAQHRYHLPYLFVPVFPTLYPSAWHICFGDIAVEWRTIPHCRETQEKSREIKHAEPVWHTRCPLSLPLKIHIIHIQTIFPLPVLLQMTGNVGCPRSGEKQETTVLRLNASLGF